MSGSTSQFGVLFTLELTTHLLKVCAYIKCSLMRILRKPDVEAYAINPSVTGISILEATEDPLFPHGQLWTPIPVSLTRPES